MLRQKQAEFFFILIRLKLHHTPFNVVATVPPGPITLYIAGVAGPSMLHVVGRDSRIRGKNGGHCGSRHWAALNPKCCGHLGCNCSFWIRILITVSAFVSRSPIRVFGAHCFPITVCSLLPAKFDREPNALEPDALGSRPPRARPLPPNHCNVALYAASGEAVAGIRSDTRASRPKPEFL